MDKYRDIKRKIKLENYLNSQFNSIFSSTPNLAENVKISSNCLVAVIKTIYRLLDAQNYQFTELQWWQTYEEGKYQDELHWHCSAAWNYVNGYDYTERSKPSHGLLALVRIGILEICAPWGEPLEVRGSVYLCDTIDEHYQDVIYKFTHLDEILEILNDGEESPKKELPIE